MKTALISALTATLLGFASLASGRQFDAADFTAIMFTTGLVAWTIGQYSRTPRALTVARTFRFPDRGNVPAAKVYPLSAAPEATRAPAIRLAA